MSEAERGKRGRPRAIDVPGNCSRPDSRDAEILTNLMNPPETVHRSNWGNVTLYNSIRERQIQGRRELRKMGKRPAGVGRTGMPSTGGRCLFDLTNFSA